MVQAIEFGKNAQRKADVDVEKSRDVVLREKIGRLHRAGEEECVNALLEAGRLSSQESTRAVSRATHLVEALRKGSASPIVALMREYDLNSEEGVRLMCLAEALLRIPDPATADALIRDKIEGADWRSHLGRSSVAVKGATIGLHVLSRLLAGSQRKGAFARSRDAVFRRVMRHAIGKWVRYSSVARRSTKLCRMPRNGKVMGSVSRLICWARLLLRNPMPIDIWQSM